MNRILLVKKLSLYFLAEVLNLAFLYLYGLIKNLGKQEIKAG